MCKRKLISIYNREFYEELLKMAFKKGKVLKNGQFSLDGHDFEKVYEKLARNKGCKVKNIGGSFHGIDLIISYENICCGENVKTSQEDNWIKLYEEQKTDELIWQYNRLILDDVYKIVDIVTSLYLERYRDNNKTFGITHRDMIFLKKGKGYCSLYGSKENLIDKNDITIISYTVKEIRFRSKGHEFLFRYANHILYVDTNCINKHILTYDFLDNTFTTIDPSNKRQIKNPRRNAMAVQTNQIVKDFKNGLYYIPNNKETIICKCTKVNIDKIKKDKEMTLLLENAISIRGIVTNNFKFNGSIDDFKKRFIA